MSQERPQNQDELKGTSRRSRKDEQGRDYICGCGKKYLSYPALYTHIKTKHQGNQPQGTQKTGVQTMMRRNKPKIDDKVLKQVFKYMDQENVKILKQLDQNAFGIVPIGHRIKRQNPCKQIFQAYSNINKKQNTLSLGKESNLETVLAVYLLNVGQFTSQSLYHYYLLFAKQFRSCYYDHGQQIFENCFKGEGQNKIKLFTTQECCYVPLISDFFIRYYITLECKDPNILSLIELLTYDFCSWMFDQKLTNIEVILNKEYKILNREMIQPKLFEKKLSKADQNRKQDSIDGDSNECSLEESENRNQKIQQEQVIEIEKSQIDKNNHEMDEEVEILSINGKEDEEQEKKVND